MSTREDVCRKLKKYWDELDFYVSKLKSRLEDFVNTGVSLEAEKARATMKKISEKTHRLETEMDFDLTHTISGQKIIYKIKHVEALEGGEYDEKKFAMLSIRRSRKFGEKVVRVGDTLLAGDGIVVTAGFENVVGKDAKPIVYTVLGFEAGTNLVVASYEYRSLKRMMTKSTKNIIIDDSNVFKMLNK